MGFQGMCKERLVAEKLYSGLDKIRHIVRRNWTIYDILNFNARKSRKKILKNQEGIFGFV